MPRLFPRDPGNSQAQRKAKSNRQDRLAQSSDVLKDEHVLAYSPAIFNPSSDSDTCPRKNSATIRPSNMTRIRSDKPRTSSNSDDTSSTPAPPSRARTMRL